MVTVDWETDRYHTRYDARWRAENPPEPIAPREPHPYLGDDEAETPCRFPLSNGRTCAAELDLPVHDPHRFRQFT